METAWLVPLSLAFGVVLGAAMVIIVFAAARQGQAAANVVASSVPDGVDEVIDALESAGVVVDPSNTVLKASPAALAFGLVWNDALVHPELVTLVDRVRREGTPIAEEIALARGPYSEPTRPY